MDNSYKAAIMSILDSKGEILITPINFFTDKRNEKIRTSFLNKFIIKKLNIFNESVFATTTYNVCSFAFVKKTKEDNEEQFFPVNIYPSGQKTTFQLSYSFGYRLGGKEEAVIMNEENIFSRLTESSRGFITNIKLYATDSRDQKIRLEYDENHCCGKSTDRTYVTLVSDREISINDQKQIVEDFNSSLNEYRKKCYDVNMTNFRDYGRKRISFDFAHHLASYVYFKK